jgi:hypothetical protein
MLLHFNHLLIRWWSEAVMSKKATSVVLEREEAQGLRTLAAKETLAGRPMTVSALVRRLVKRELKRRRGELRSPEAAA